MNSLIERAKQLDHKDVLADYSKRFVAGDYPIYLDGNSLGKLPIDTIERVNSMVKNQWGSQLINSWNDHWLDLPKRIACQLESLLGAAENSIYVGESTSLNLYKLVLGFVLSENYQANLTTDSLNFPSDNYISEGIAKQHGAHYHLLPYNDEIEADIAVLKSHIENNPGIVCLSMVSFKSAYYYPVKELNTWAENHQSIIVWDMSHAVGICDIDCRDLGIQAAVGCTYKYLNGGPGSPAFLMLNPKLIDCVANPIQGWFGHQNPFEFNSHYTAETSIDRFANGTPSILSMSALEVGVGISLEAGIKHIAQKNKKQIAFLIEAVHQYLIDYEFELFCPDSIDRMGGHLSISHPKAKAIVEVLKLGADKFPKVLPDFRPPNLIRLGVASLYVSFEDLARTIEFLKMIVITKMHENVSLENRIVL